MSTVNHSFSDVDELNREEPHCQLNSSSNKPEQTVESLLATSWHKHKTVRDSTEEAIALSNTEVSGDICSESQREVVDIFFLCCG